METLGSPVCFQGILPGEGTRGDFYHRGSTAVERGAGRRLRRAKFLYVSGLLWNRHIPANVYTVTLFMLKFDLRPHA